MGQDQAMPPYAQANPVERGSESKAPSRFVRCRSRRTLAPPSTTERGPKRRIWTVMAVATKEKASAKSLAANTM